MSDDVTLTLSRDEALVLFDLLARFQETEAMEIEDPSEERVLWDLLTRMEKTLPEPFQANYLVRLEQARHALRPTQFGDT